jgi:hypothetical protein
MDNNKNMQENDPIHPTSYFNPQITKKNIIKLNFVTRGNHLLNVNILVINK